MSENCFPQEHIDEHHQLVDPDPLSLFLIWLGAVGSVSSVVALYEQRQQQKEQVRLRDISEYALAEITEHMSQIESDFALLDGQLEKMSLILRLAQSGTSNGAPMMAPESLAEAAFRFGSVRLDLPDHMMKEWARLYRETSTITKRIGAAINPLLEVLSKYRFRVNPETYHHLIEFRNHLNRVLESGDYVAAVAASRNTINAGRHAMAALRADFRG